MGGDNTRVGLEGEGVIKRSIQNIIKMFHLIRLANEHARRVYTI